MKETTESAEAAMAEVMRGTTAEREEAAVAEAAMAFAMAESERGAVGDEAPWREVLRHMEGETPPGAFFTDGTFMRGRRGLDGFEADSLAGSRRTEADEEVGTVPPSDSDGEAGIELVEAREVDEVDEVGSLLPQAHHVDEERMTMQRAIHRQRARQLRRLVHGISMVALLAVVTMSAMLWVHHGNDENDTSDNSPMTALPPSAPIDWSDGDTDSSSSADSSPEVELKLYLPQYSWENIHTFDTPQWHAFQWLSSYPDISALPTWRIQQLFALAAFFFAFEGPRWPEAIRDDWLDETISECFWHSSEYGQFDPQTGLYTPKAGQFEFNMSGSEQGENYLSGFEKYYGALRHGIRVDTCNDAGEFQVLMLAGLQLQGLRPVLPAEISLLTSLAILSLPHNGLTSNVSTILSSTVRQMNLTEIALFANHLVGTIPTDLGNMITLLDLNLTQNAISGQIPSQLGLLRKADMLDLSVNKLTGSIPSQLGTMHRLSVVFLRNNSLSGTIPATLNHIPLTRIELQGNNLSGCVPAQVCAVNQSTVLSIAQDHFGFKEFMIVSPQEKGHHRLHFDCNSKLCGCDTCRACDWFQDCPKPIRMCGPFRPCAANEQPLYDGEYITAGLVTLPLGNTSDEDKEEVEYWAKNNPQTNKSEEVPEESVNETEAKWSLKLT